VLAEVPFSFLFAHLIFVSMGATCAAPKATHSPGSPWVIAVVRSAAWGLGEDEDVWSVEVAETATIADLKAQIEELYDVPRQMQKLILPSQNSSEAINDTMPVSDLNGQRVHLLPMMADPSASLEEVMTSMQGGYAAPSPEEQAAMAEAFLGAAQETMEMRAALEESLKDVTYMVKFSRGRDCGGQAAGKEVTLPLSALALVGDVQQMVEIELFGAVGAEPAFLVLGGQPLPPDLPIHHVGIEDGVNVDVVLERPQSAEELLLQGLMGGGMFPAGMPPAVAVN
jgi:hypothetical protein